MKSIIAYILVGCWYLSGGSALAQPHLPLQLSRGTNSIPSIAASSLAPLTGFPSPSFFSSDSLLRPSGQFLPRYARDNPTGYSILCRTELAVERQLPIGVWINLNEISPLHGQIMSTAHLRLRRVIE